jgi:hypothetical protein
MRSAIIIIFVVSLLCGKESAFWMETKRQDGNETATWLDTKRQDGNLTTATWLDTKRQDGNLTTATWLDTKRQTVSEQVSKFVSSPDPSTKLNDINNLISELVDQISD